MQSGLQEGRFKENIKMIEKMLESKTLQGKSVPRVIVSSQV